MLLSSKRVNGLNPQGHPNKPEPHGHGHLPSTGAGIRGQGPSIDPNGNLVPSNSPEAYWPIRTTPLAEPPVVEIPEVLLPPEIFIP